MNPLQSLSVLPVLLIATALPDPSLATKVGVREISVTTPERGRDLSVTVWYPAEAGGKPVMVGDNRVFKGAPASADAPFAGGRYPLVVMSHGSGSRIQGMTWLATALAKAGFVVAGPNHPGTTSGDSTPANTPKIWERTQDLSAVIDALTADPRWNGAIDAENIGVVGFSLGGSAAMEIAGARADLEAYARYCDAYTQWDCKWFAGGVGYVNEEQVKVDRLNLRTIDKARFEQSNLDRRIKSAVLVDPGLAQAYDEESLKRIAIPMNFINLGDVGTVPPGVIADKLAALTPHGTYVAVEGSDHYSFLPECREGAAEMLKSVGEVDPICDETARPRAEIHAELEKLIVTTLQRTLGVHGE
ncbi:alpha/beta hydrolase family protein [Mesorhizobium sp. ASY16-5R]|uniref:alpha/beta hydrolase family protein n=1 Tax=Mesorhizobium sp. ASY16-5R TaxID=3445772 RepID=UPI003F9ECC9E